MQLQTTAVILLGHGSRLPAANQGLEQVAGQVRTALGGLRTEVAFLQLAQPDLATAVARCVAGGARRVAVVPFFLFPGAHIREDIPAELDALQKLHPGVEFHLAGVLGDHPKLIEAAVERAKEVLP